MRIRQFRNGSCTPPSASMSPPRATGSTGGAVVLAGLFALGAMGMSGKGALSATYKE